VGAPNIEALKPACRDPFTNAAAAAQINQGAAVERSEMAAARSVPIGELQT
jgi:hypothetical protein